MTIAKTRIRKKITGEEDMKDYEALEYIEVGEVIEYPEYGEAEDIRTTIKFRTHSSAKRRIIADVSDFAKDGEPYAFRIKAPNGLVAYFQDAPEEGIVSLDPDALIWHEEPNTLQ